MRRRRLHREATDFLVLAVCLVFLVRCFVAEPYSVPTGSMAPGLLGRHKSVVCPHCGAKVVVSNSEDADSSTGDSSAVTGVCGNCRREIDLSTTPSSDGDGVLVLKHPFDGYHRFDAAVFRQVDEPRTLFVKRIVGLPGEIIRIRRGDIERLDQEGGWTICRKPPDLIRYLAVPVYDDRFRAEGAPPRWVGAPESAWKQADGIYRCTARYPNVATLEYRHAVGHNGEVGLITDEMEYNSGIDATRAENAAIHRGGPGHPVADLLVEFNLSAVERPAVVTAFLNAGPDRVEWQASFEKGGGVEHSFVCGRERMWIPERSAVKTSRYCFANVDQQLLLWQDDVLIFRKAWRASDGVFPQKSDLHPISIEVRDGAVEIGALRVLRDVYYSRQTNMLDFIPPREADWTSRPETWRLVQRDLHATREWKIPSRQYLMLGDNSARSRDSRRWIRSPFVDEWMLLGRDAWRTTPLGRWAKLPGGE